MGQSESISYNQEQREMEMINAFRSLCRRVGHAVGISVEPVEEPVDPLLKELNPLFSRIAELKGDAERYSCNHINQDFRRIDAELNQLLAKLDSVRVPEDRQDVRDEKKKKGYKENDAAVKLLWREIHDNDVAECGECLPLG